MSISESVIGRWAVRLYAVRRRQFNAETRTWLEEGDIVEYGARHLVDSVVADRIVTACGRELSQLTRRGALNYFELRLADGQREGECEACGRLADARAEA